MAQSHYVVNRAPLQPSALVQLPAGTIEPRGWLRQQLRLQADGFHGHLGEISPFLRKEGNAWLDPRGRGQQGWEEVPYWLKGYLNAAMVLGDDAMLAEARVWIEGAINSQQEDGWFGPDEGRTGAATRLKGREDLWPNMIMLFCLMDYHSLTNDERVIGLMTRYFRYLLQVPEDRFLVGYWPKMRAGDQLHAIHWLYNRTGDAWLLDLAERTHRLGARWDEGLIDMHNVNIAQGFREPTQWWVQSGDASHLTGAERVWREVRERFGGVPGGMFAGDENCRPGFHDPRQCVETCGMVEEMLSCSMLAAITGDAVWAERCEDVAFNSLPAAFTDDMGALRYLTAPNLVVSDSRSHSPGIQNGGPMFLMSPHRHRCCQHNAGHGWPYLARHLWYATPDGGLAAMHFMSCTVRARVGSHGDIATVYQDSDYPFGERVRLKFELEKPVHFPLLVRIPSWTDEPRAFINGVPVGGLNPEPGSIARIERTFMRGDTLDLVMPMPVRVRRFENNHGSVSIDRGPLTYSLEIDEEVRVVPDAGAQDVSLSAEERVRLDARWPACELHPRSPWNLAISTRASHGEAKVVTHEGVTSDAKPWSRQSVPIALEVEADEVEAWGLDRHGLVSTLQTSPVASAGRMKSVRLIPMGAARLRVSAFPVAAGVGQKGHIWSAPAEPVRDFRLTASHRASSQSSGGGGTESGDEASDMTGGRISFWPRRGTVEWVEARFDVPRTLHAVSVFWFHDEGTGQSQIPESWRVLSLEPEGWVPVATSDEFGVRRGTYNTVTFEPVTTEALKLEITLRAEFSGGVVDLQVE